MVGDCKGCNPKKIGICHYKAHGMKDECPCIECLVKVMCISQCTKFDETLNRLIEIKYNLRLDSVVCPCEKCVGTRIAEEEKGEAWWRYRVKTV